MKGGKTPKGYTIIELMIVLAVSGLMFLIASSFISDKHVKTAFNDGINDFASRIQSVIEEVNDGQYTDIKVNCTYAGSSVSISSGNTQQGQNTQCVFLGKVIHFQENTGDNELSHYEMFSLAGGRQNNGDLVAADPTVIPELTRHEDTPQQLNIESVVVNGQQVYALAFLQSLGTFDTATGTVTDGSQNVKMYSPGGPGPNTTSADAVTHYINVGSLYGVVQTADICVTDGERHGIINIGENNNQLAVKVKHLGTNPCPFI